jgi:hypothetical protein
LPAATVESRARLAALDASQENMNPVLIRDVLAAIS